MNWLQKTSTIYDIGYSEIQVQLSIHRIEIPLCESSSNKLKLMENLFTLPFLYLSRFGRPSEVPLPLKTIFTTLSFLMTDNPL